MDHADSKHNPYDNLGQVLFLSINDILSELQLPPLNDSFDTKHWEDLTPEQRAFFRDTAKKHFTTVFLSKIEVNGKKLTSL